MSIPPSSDEQWKALRDLLKSALLATEIPLESTEMRPKAVWQKYKDEQHPGIQCVDYTVKSSREKFTRMLRALRKKQKDGDLENEDKPKVIRWRKSAAKQYLKKCFRENLISTTYQDPEQVWKDNCENHPSFARMKYDDTFVRRLETVKDDYVRKLGRCQKDLEAYTIAKENHPTPKFNSRGEPQWNGSAAQRFLKELIAKKEHVGKEPGDIWGKRPEFKVYSKQTFRDHIYQEERLLKFRNYVEQLKQKKVDELEY